MAVLPSRLRTNALAEIEENYIDTKTIFGEMWENAMEQIDSDRPISIDELAEIFYKDGSFMSWRLAHGIANYIVLNLKGTH